MGADALLYLNKKINKEILLEYFKDKYSDFGEVKFRDFGEARHIYFNNDKGRKSLYIATSKEIVDDGNIQHEGEKTLLFENAYVEKEEGTLKDIAKVFGGYFIEDDTKSEIAKYIKPIDINEGKYEKIVEENKKEEVKKELRFLLNKYDYSEEELLNILKSI